jgi:hypothetical protein
VTGYGFTSSIWHLRHRGFSPHATWSAGKFRSTAGGKLRQHLGSRLLLS